MTQKLLQRLDPQTADKSRLVQAYILAKEYDVKLAEQYQGMKATLQASFRLLKAISRGNAVVQGRLFDQLDFLLAVKGAEAEMAEAVLEVNID